MLAEAGEDEPEGAAARGLRGEVGVQRVPREQEAPAGAAEALLAEPPDGEEGEPRGPQDVAAERAREAHPGAQRRERRHERVEDAWLEAAPDPVEPPPRVAVAGREGVERARGLVEVARERDARAVRKRVRQDERPVQPAQPVALELERADRRRRGGERVEGAEDVVDEPGLGQLRAADGAARLRLRLEHVDVPAGVREQVRRHEPVRPGADHDRVGHRRSLRPARLNPTFRPPERAPEVWRDPLERSTPMHVRHSLDHRARLWIVALALALVVAGAFAGRAAGVPLRGHTPWSILLCQYNDVADAPQPPRFFREFLTNDGTALNGAADYFRDQSRGRITLDGSVVRGWFRMSQTAADDSRPTVTRWEQIQHCVDAAARGGYTVPAGHRIMAVTNADTGSGAAGDRVLMSPGVYSLDFAAHEMLHSYGLGHSYSDDRTFRAETWSAAGEYHDPWDEMSAQLNFSFPTRFGQSATTLNGYHLDKLGWLPMSRVLTLGADGVGSRTITMAPLEAFWTPGPPGPQLVRIPFDGTNPHHYYTVEFRQRVGWSAAIPADTMLIREVKGGISHVLRVRGMDAGVQSLSADGVTIARVPGRPFDVTITSDIPDVCLGDFFWRQARPADRVCVSWDVREQTRADNAIAPGRWVGGAFGPHTCVDGFVWRDAFPGDDVCTTRDRRAQAAADNAAAADRRNPARFAFGPNTCAKGFVWREIDETDYVCVTPATRDRARADNAAAPGRWAEGKPGSHTCPQGFVWRDAFPGDDVCTTRDQRDQAAADNAANHTRLSSVIG